MKKNTARPLILLALAVTAATADAAVSSPSPVTFTINQTYGAMTTSQIVFDSIYLTASLPAFDTTLGTLESFTVTWSLSGLYSGTLSTGGGVGSSYSAPFSIASFTVPNPISSSNPGGGNGNGGGPGTVLSIPFTAPSNPVSFERTLNAADAGTLYDQGILNAVTGTAPVTHSWSTPLTITGNWSNLTVTGNASASISYTYSPIPEASTFALGLAALGTACLRRRRL